MATIITHHKSKAVFQIDVTNSSKSTKESFHVFFTSLVAQATDVNSAHGEPKKSDRDEIDNEALGSL